MANYAKLTVLGVLILAIGLLVTGGIGAVAAMLVFDKSLAEVLLTGGSALLPALGLALIALFFAVTTFCREIGSAAVEHLMRRQK